MKRSGRAWGGERLGARIAALAAAGVVAAAGTGRAQGLASYDYENLGFRGVGAEVGWVDAKSMDHAALFGLRFDLGYLGPQVRVMPRFAFWGSDLQAQEVQRLEARIEELVGLATGSVQIGAVERDVLIFGADLQWAPGLRVLSPYLGVGGEVYILNGSGTAIDETFVEEALDLVTAGISAVGGLELPLGPSLRAYAELRGTLVTDVRNVALSGGLMLTPGR